MNRKGITKLIVDRIGSDRTGPDRTGYVHRIGSIHRTILDSEQMVTIGMGKQVQSTGYDIDKLSSICALNPVALCRRVQK
jgi:hypothetical protein